MDIEQYNRLAKRGASEEAPVEDRPKGKIRASWDVFCGGCYLHEHLDGTDAYRHGGRAALARHKGWQLTRARGWLCPLCRVSAAAGSPPSS